MGLGQTVLYSFVFGVTFGLNALTGIDGFGTALWVELDGLDRQGS